MDKFHKPVTHIDKKKEEKVRSTLSTGTNGMILSTKIKKGNSDKKKLKAILLARVVRVPFKIPITYNSSNWYTEIDLASPKRMF